ncbi:MAG TPA: serine--tRNA ligase [Acidimicrobiia bacterium]|nr:serine--tRNA ligase [Acidimicrobiia bacterium]
MIDLKRLREEPEYRAGIERKRVRDGLVDDVLAADAAARAVRTQVELLRAEQNALSKQVGRASKDERPAKIAAAGALKEQLQTQEDALAQLELEVRALALQVPNPADASVPDGGEDDGAVVHVVGDTPAAPALDHAAFGEAMGWVESEQAVVMSGSRFAYLMREAVLLELALVQWVTSKLVADGFTPVVPPVLVREEAMEQAGFFPTDRSQVYEVDDDELFLVGTSEVPLSAIHRDEILAAERLPARYLGISSCFRREAGTYGKDTRGIFRVHQFDKVEMFSYADPATSWDEHEALLAIEESIVGGLGLPYRVVNIAAGDLGAAAAKKYDVEVWLPSESAYRELTSCSNYLDFSARRLATRVKGADSNTGAGNQLVHTLNGTACAVGRTLVFLFEHYQDADGGFTVPEVLRPFTGFARVEAR